jgi:hypothetical protein
MVSIPFSETFDSLFVLASNTFDGGVLNDGKCVEFSEWVKVVEIPSARELSRKERKALWYPDPAGQKMVKIRKLLCVIEDFGGREEERQDGDEYEETAERQRLPIAAVLMEQKSQRELGMNDAEFIAKIYRQCSQQSIVKAQQRAQQDELEAIEYISHKFKSRRRKGILGRL